jgi:hypothetical protein
MPRYFVSVYTDGPAMRWNVIDRQTQEWARRFASEAEAKAYADKLNDRDIGIRDYRDGKPYYCKTCGLGWHEMMACEEGDCVDESQEDAEKRYQPA